MLWRRGLLQVGDNREILLQQMGVLLWIWMVGHFSIGFPLYLQPVIRRFLVHKKAVLFQMFNRGTHLRVALEDLVKEVACTHVDTLSVESELTGHDLFLKLHGIFFF